MSAHPTVPSKRFSNANGEEKTLKQRRYYHHDHKINITQLLEGDANHAAQSFGSADDQLQRAALLVLKAVGFEAAEPEALESLVSLTEEYMSHFLASVRKSMLSARRAQPIPHDFTEALSDNSLTLSSLLLHLDPPVSPSSIQPPMSVEDSDRDESVQQAQLIDHLLTLNAKSQSYIPTNFPALPSRHTFKADAVYRPATFDAKQIREQATVEGRLGEEALRRLMAKKASDDDHLLAASHSDRRIANRQRARTLWRETYERALRASTGDDHNSMAVDPPEGARDPDNSKFHVGPAINADGAYWRKPITRRLAEPSISDG